MLKKSYAKKGDDVVRMNYEAIDRGANELVEIEVDPSWANPEVEAPKKQLALAVVVEKMVALQQISTNIHLAKVEAFVGIAKPLMLSGVSFTSISI